MRRLALLGIALAGCATAKPALAPVPAVPDELEGTVEQLQKDAQALDPQVASALAKQFLAATAKLPHVPPRTIYKSADKKHWYSDVDASKLPEADRKTLTAVKVDEPLYYETKYGSPLAYARALDILGQQGLQPSPPIAYADFGYGGIGSLRLLESLGWTATGIDVDPMLPVLYAGEGDWGGRIRILDGKFPTDPKIAQALGSGLQLFISKNTLKRGYIHPDRPADDKFLIHLEVTDAQFLGAVHDALAPGGWFLIYNICPALTPPDKPFVPWSDGRSPFSREQFEAAGFEVLVFDRDDTDAIRKLAHTLRWDVGEGAMDLQNDLSVIYTLVRRK